MLGWGKVVQVGAGEAEAGTVVGRTEAENHMVDLWWEGVEEGE